MKAEWLKTSYIGPCPCCKINGGKYSFIDKTLKGITNFFNEGVFSETYAKEKGLMQAIDPRVKVITVLILVVAVSLLRHLTLIAGIYLLILVVAVASRIPLMFFIARVWLFIPLFSGIIAIPALFNVFVPGESLVTLIRFEKGWSLGPLEIPDTISVTRQGLSTASIFVMRVATSVSIVVLLVLTTRWQSLLKALRVLWVPQMFVFVTGMTYRYIHLLLRLIEDTHLAKKSRVIRNISAGAGQRWVASQIGFIFKKSVKMSEDVYLSMLSRGFTDEVRTASTFRTRPIDYIWACLSALLIFIVLQLNSMWG